MNATYYSGAVVLLSDELDSTYTQASQQTIQDHLVPSPNKLHMVTPLVVE